MQFRSPKSAKNAAIASVFLGFFGLACERETKPEPPRVTTRPSAELSDLLAPDPAASTLREIRNEKLTLSAPAAESQQLAFAPGRLAQIRELGILVQSTKDWQTVVELQTEALRAVVTLSDGATLAVSPGGTLHLERFGTKFEALARVPLFPGAQLFPELSNPKFLWVAGPGRRTLVRFSLTEDDVGLLLITGTYDLVDFDAQALGLLRDAAFAYTSGESLTRFPPWGRARKFELPAGQKPVRIISAQRLDQAWLVYEDGRVALVSFLPKLPKSIEFTLPERIFAAVKAKAGLAFISVEPPSKGPHRFWLSVYDFQGKQKLRLALSPETASADPSWFARMLRNKALAASIYEPLVAVGGQETLGVWNTETGEKLFSR